MAIFRHIQTAFWKDPKIIEDMTPEDRLFFLYILTNPSTTQIGIYNITKKQIAFELGYSTEVINSLIHRFENQHKVIRYNEETREICIVNWGKYNLNKGGKPIIDCVTKEVGQVKDKTLLKLVAHKIEKEEIKVIFTKAYDTYNDTPTISTQKEKEKEKQKENKKEKEIGEKEYGNNNERPTTEQLEKARSFMQSRKQV
ncbi:MAG: hypothetical protein ACRCXT_19365 [Paraclostridium sp.]